MLDRFLEAETTLEEERRLYAYFSQAEVDSSLETYRAMMNDYAALMPVEQVRQPAKRVALQPWFKWASGIAAVVALAFVGTWGYRAYETSKLEDIYGGSYIIVNGERVDNLREIKAQIESTLQSAQEIERLAAAFPPTDVEESVLSEIDDPALREEVNRLLNE
ncbi:MAG: hypothetical protein IJR56_00655 [Bacteroidaceae bacterium]|nr:hypothetical protein [Bacteroidaceae bacterium]MBQ9883207.1 hypothetical protein [Bacteroidaceae bacterium]